MRRTTITIDGTRHILNPPVDTAAVKAAITDVLRHGPGFIDLHLLGERTISTLVSPGFGITLETIELPDDNDPTEPFELIDYDDLDFADHEHP